MMITGCNPINDAKDSLQGQIVLDNDHDVNVKVDNNKWTLTKEQISGYPECIIFN